jgi:hypothetical protein
MRRASSSRDNAPPVKAGRRLEVPVSDTAPFCERRRLPGSSVGRAPAARPTSAMLAFWCEPLRLKRIRHCKRAGNSC